MGAPAEIELVVGSVEEGIAKVMAEVAAVIETEKGPPPIVTTGGAEGGVDAGTFARLEPAARIDRVAEDTGVIGAVEGCLDLDGHRLATAAADGGTAPAEDGRAIIGSGNTRLGRQWADGKGKKNKRRNSQYERQSASIRYIGAIGKLLYGKQQAVDARPDVLPD